jgi:hypothetical protein
MASDSGLGEATGWSLADGECLGLTPSMSARLLCVGSGRVWATIEGDQKDHILVRKQDLLLPVDRLTVFEAWGAAGARGWLCSHDDAAGEAGGEAESSLSPGPVGLKA